MNIEWHENDYKSLLSILLNFFFTDMRLNESFFMIIKKKKQRRFLVQIFCILSYIGIPVNYLLFLYKAFILDGKWCDCAVMMTQYL